MSAELVIANSLRIASEDLQGARVLAAQNNRNAAYLCEQAAEKIIRAVLTAEGKHCGVGHRLHEFVDLVPDENPCKSMLREIEHMSSYATAYRYVTDAGRIKPAPSGAVILADIEKVARVLAEVVARFEVELERPNAPARRPGPIR